MILHADKLCQEGFYLYLRFCRQTSVTYASDWTRWSHVNCANRVVRARDSYVARSKFRFSRAILRSPGN